MGDPARRPDVRRRGPGRRGGPAGPAVRRPVGQAARPADARGARASPASACYIANVVKCRPPGNRDPAARRDRRRAGRSSSSSSTSSARRSSSRSATSPRSCCSRPRTASPSCGAQLPVRATACSSRRCTRPPSLRGGGEPLAQMRADLVRAKLALAAPARGSDVIADGTRAPSVDDDAGARPAALAELRPARRPRAARRRARRRQDRVRPGLRRRPRRHRADHEPDVHARREYDGPAARCTTSTSTASSSSSEVLDLGLAELLDDGGVTLIEWGDAILAGAAGRLPRGAARATATTTTTASLDVACRSGRRWSAPARRGRSTPALDRRGAGGARC